MCHSNCDHRAPSTLQSPLPGTRTSSLESQAQTPREGPSQGLSPLTPVRPVTCLPGNGVVLMPCTYVSSEPGNTRVPLSGRQLRSPSHSMACSPQASVAVSWVGGAAS